MTASVKDVLGAVQMHMDYLIGEGVKKDRKMRGDMCV